MHGKTRRIMTSFGALIAFAAVAGASDKALEEVRAMTEAAEQGTEVLHQYIRDGRVSAPTIYSQWYVDRLVEKRSRRAELEQARRDFGKAVLVALERTAVENLNKAESERRERAALMLLDLADWFGEAVGYGNAFVFKRCQDMATVPIAHLIGDLAFPEEKAAVLVSRLVPFPEDVKRNARVLNQEGPSGLFVPGRGTADHVLWPLERAWATKRAEIRKWQKEHGKRVHWAGKQVREELPEEYQFFCDDDLSRAPKPFTTLAQWDRKYHRRLLLGLEGHNIRKVKHLLLFREKVGRFPTKAPSWWKPGNRDFTTPVHVAFDDAWEPYRKEYGPIYGSAAEVYNALQSNTFYDGDTRRVKRSEAFQKANEEIRKAGARARTAAGSCVEESKTEPSPASAAEMLNGETQALPRSGGRSLAHLVVGLGAALVGGVVIVALGARLLGRRKRP